MTERAENGRPTTHLEFVQAMKDFTTMFPEMDRDVIEEVSRMYDNGIYLQIVGAGFAGEPGSGGRDYRPAVGHDDG